MKNTSLGIFLVLERGNQEQGKPLEGGKKTLKLQKHQLTSPSARFFSNSRCFACSSAMRASMASNDSRVKGRNKLRSSSDIESRSSVIVYMANNESLRFPRHGAHESRSTDHSSNIHGAMLKMTHLSLPLAKSLNIWLFSALSKLELDTNLTNTRTHKLAACASFFSLGVGEGFSNFFHVLPLF